uniref:Uncharacterized protein n=1 Tax=Kwoniella pini CBS 10737 TaxID=1296096 RepID=A0A1B9I5D9_9TREE|nr:uncharacterized protein I206_02796 [Kwoniella pini CBS 10737]OCF50740.1 hypothetical protein I206_02796 [Kwoniella pini CBS 10737]
MSTQVEQSASDGWKPQGWRMPFRCKRCTEETKKKCTPDSTAGSCTRCLRRKQTCELDEEKVSKYLARPEHHKTDDMETFLFNNANRNGQGHIVDTSGAGAQGSANSIYLNSFQAPTVYGPGLSSYTSYVPPDYSYGYEPHVTQPYNQASDPQISVQGSIGSDMTKPTWTDQITGKTYYKCMRCQTDPMTPCVPDNAFSKRKLDKADCSSCGVDMSRAELIGYTMGFMIVADIVPSYRTSPKQCGDQAGRNSNWMGCLQSIP